MGFNMTLYEYLNTISDSNRSKKFLVESVKDSREIIGMFDLKGLKSIVNGNDWIKNSNVVRHKYDDGVCVIYVSF